MNELCIKVEEGGIASSLAILWILLPPDEQRYVGRSVTD